MKYIHLFLQFIEFILLTFFFVLRLAVLLLSMVGLIGVAGLTVYMAIEGSLTEREAVLSLSLLASLGTLFYFSKDPNET